VEEVTADSKASKVLVKGKNVDPLKVCERIQKKSGRKVELISPLPKPPQENNKKDEKKEELPKEEKKEEVNLNLFFILFIGKVIYVCPVVMSFDNIELYIDIYVRIRDLHYILLKCELFSDPTLYVNAKCLLVCVQVLVIPINILIVSTREINNSIIT
ncbi:hypothetical protein HAX54_014895, partial [Datura stramonium]|nr:hypothetical protein [Datura stramonium]